MPVKNRLKEILMEKGTKQLYIANKIGMSKSTFSNLIHNKFTTSMEYGFKIAKELDMKFEDIFYYEEDK